MKRRRHLGNFENRGGTERRRSVRVTKDRHAFFDVTKDVAVDHPPTRVIELGPNGDAATGLDVRGVLPAARARLAVDVDDLEAVAVEVPRMRAAIHVLDDERVVAVAREVGRRHVGEHGAVDRVARLSIDADRAESPREIGPARRCEARDIVGRKHRLCGGDLRGGVVLEVRDLDRAAR